MNIVTPSTFRTNQSRYLNMAKSGSDVVIKSRLGSFMLVPVADQPTDENKSLLSDLRGALEDVKSYIAGDKGKMRPVEELIDEL